MNPSAGNSPSLTLKVSSLPSRIGIRGTPVSFSQFFQGLDREGLMLAPAAGSGVVVAALQVPLEVQVGVGPNWDRAH